MKTAVALLTTVVVALLGAQLYLWRTEDSRIVPEGSPPPRQDALAPKEVYWILIKMTASPDVAPQNDQRQRMLTVLQEGVKYTAEMNDLWIQAQDIVRRALNADQRAFINRSLDDMRAHNQRIGGGPMNEQLTQLLKSRMESDFTKKDVNQLLADARALPLAESTAAPNPLNPEDFAWAVTILETNETLKINKNQAIQIAPFVKVQTDLFQFHEREKTALLATLDARQMDFVRNVRAKGYNPNDPPFAEPGDLIKALK